MKKTVFALAMVMASVSFAQLSTKVIGTLKSYQYSKESSGFYLTINGKAAETLYLSIVNNGGAIDLDSYRSTKGKLTTETHIAYSKSLVCKRDITDLKPIKKEEIKVEYSCEIDISKDGIAKEPARG